MSEGVFGPLGTKENSHVFKFIPADTLLVVRGLDTAMRKAWEPQLVEKYYTVCGDSWTSASILKKTYKRLAILHGEAATTTSRFVDLLMSKMLDGTDHPNFQEGADVAMRQLETTFIPAHGTKPYSDVLHRITDFLKKPNPLVRNMGVRMLCRLHTKEQPVAPIVECLRDDSELVRLSVVRNLSRIKPSPEIGPIVMKIAKDKPEYGVTTLRALCETVEAEGEREKIELVVHSLKDPNPAVRKTALECLPQMVSQGDTTIIPEMLKLLADKDVRVTASKSLHKMMTGGNPDITAGLMELLDHPEDDTRCAAIHLIGKVDNDGDTTTKLLSILEDFWWKPREAVLHVLPQVSTKKNKAVVAAVDKALLDREWFVRRAAATCWAELNAVSSPRMGRGASTLMR